MKPLKQINAFLLLATAQMGFAEPAPINRYDVPSKYWNVHKYPDDRTLIGLIKSLTADSVTYYNPGGPHLEDYVRWGVEAADRTAEWDKALSIPFFPYYCDQRPDQTKLISVFHGMNGTKAATSFLT